jgi:hypothetical protein
MNSPVKAVGLLNVREGMDKPVPPVKRNVLLTVLKLDLPVWLSQITDISRC